ncbi:uncharacterized protein LOC113522265 [Galleria mellonella]|uniref:Uncharacterized protein LOC113522265 n=1 Tax=Galleria mellonella TaxID=7137 RepID=A0A6J1X8F0_GALME|nr:uncharacterized protein LOC113522265 [Galleria mellonella]
MRGLIILVFVTQVYCDTQAVQHSMYISRKSRSNSPPFETGYVFSKSNNGPGTFAVFGNSGSALSSFSTSDAMDKHRNPSIELSKYYDPPMTKYSGLTVPIGSQFPAPITEHYIEPVTKFDIDYEKAKAEVKVMSGPPVTEPSIEPTTKYDIDFEKAKSEAKMISMSATEPNSIKPTKYNFDYEKAKADAIYDSKYIPAKIKSDAMYERLKSVMYYDPSGDNVINEIGYDISNDYHIDDNDVRTSSRNVYDSWPYYYHSPYEYEIMKVDSDIQKAKDKRYAVDAPKDFIPVYESPEYDIPNQYGSSLSTARYNRDLSTDNPIVGNRPFFSFALNDYYDKHQDDDHLEFKGLDWGKDFDDETLFPDIDEYVKRNRRLENSNQATIHPAYIQTNHIENEGTAQRGKSSTEKGYTKKHKFDKSDKGENSNEHHKKGYEKSNHNYRGFKDFIDTFANRFGAEDHKKDANYIIKKDQDKGENRKGFRRIYHKDEYQEDNEFFDNNRNSAHADEKGSSTLHNGGSEALLQSHAAAAIGNEASASQKAGNTENKKFANSHKGHDFRNGYDSNFNRYRDVAKKAAQSNSADYSDNFRV